MPNVFTLIEVYSPTIPLITYLRKPTKNRWTIALILYCIIYILLATYANFFPTVNHSNIFRYLLITIFSFVSFCLLIDLFIDKKKFSKINKLVIIATIIFSIINFVWWEGTSAYNSNSSAVASLILLIYCIYYFKLQLEQLKNTFIERQPSFWIVSGIFLYCGINFFVFTLYRPLTLTYEYFAHDAWYVTVIVILITNIFFAKGIQCSWK